MAKTFTIHGGSDDLIETAGIPGCGEFNVICDGPYMGSVRIDSEVEDASVRVHCIYDGCWSFAVGQVTDDEPFPAWPIKVDRGGDKLPEYSMRVWIDVPDDAVLVPEFKVRR